MKGKESKGCEGKSSEIKRKESGEMKKKNVWRQDKNIILRNIEEKGKQKEK